jgi:hypothetical protein
MAATPKPVRKYMKNTLLSGPKGKKEEKKFGKKMSDQIKKQHVHAKSKGQKLYGVTKKGKYVGNE